MSSKYYWQGVDIKEITNTTSTSNLFFSNFADFPAQLSSLNALTTEPAGLVTNDGAFSSISSPNTSYFCYNDSEEGSAPPFRMQDKSIFTTTYSNNRIIVKSQSINSGSGTITIPDWCNGVKFKFISLKGNDGNPGTGVDARQDDITNSDHENEEYHRDEHKNYDGGLVDNFHNNKDDHINIHHNNNNVEIYHWAAATGGAAGIGGTGKLGWYYKAILFDAGTNNKITYSINSSANGISQIQLKQGSSEVANITYSNGGNGGNATNARTATTQNFYNLQQFDNNDQRGDHNEDHHNNNLYIVQRGSTAGVNGSGGTSGQVNTGSHSDDFKYLHYNSSLMSSNERLVIYYFKFDSN